MNVLLPSELENYVNAKIDSGHYTSPLEVVTKALHLLEEHDQTRADQLTDFNQELGRRLDSLNQGVYVSPSEARARLALKSTQHRQA